mmetsp:Transcript_41673/g.88787  ORF Transcript_41673/g.88787 Transcript_41673/m.88787 type:complete len:92 (-) Transcript_41673:6-281(-)
MVTEGAGVGWVDGKLVVGSLVGMMLMEGGELVETAIISVMVRADESETPKAIDNAVTITKTKQSSNLVRVCFHHGIDGIAMTTASCLSSTR